MMRDPLDTRKTLGVVEALTEARDLLVKEGWVQGVYADQVDYESLACRRCSLGALRQMDYRDHPHVVVTMEMQDILLAAMRQVDNDAGDGVLIFHSVIQWNDAPTRTKEQVLQAFNLAIEIAQSREVSDA
jgi:hypothetical protein